MKEIKPFKNNQQVNDSVKILRRLINKQSEVKIKKVDNSHELTLNEILKKEITKRNSKFELC